MNFEKTESIKSFCLAPFHSLYVDTTNEIRPCCISTLENIQFDNTKNLKSQYNSVEMKKLRKSLCEGDQHPSCNHCWNAEKVGMPSLRQGINSRYKKYFELIKDSIDDDYTINQLDIKYLDIRFNNKCNLKCRTCSPRFSSSWYNDHKKRFPEIVIDKKLDSDVTLDSIKEILHTVDDIYFAGGEPLITDQHYEVLQYLIDNNLTHVAISYNTNFSKLIYKNHDVLEYWKKFKYVTVAASLDGNHEKGEYIRKNIDWKAVLENRKRIKDECPSINFSINCTLSILNAYDIVSLHKEWVDLNFINPNEFHVNLLFGPDHFKISNLPRNHKMNLEEIYKNHINWLKQYSDTENVISGYLSAISMLKENQQDNWQQKFLHEIKSYDEIRNEDFFQTFPEYKDLGAYIC